MVRHNQVCIFFAILLTLIMATAPVAAHTEIYVYDNFNDGDLEGWNLTSVYHPKTCASGTNFECPGTIGDVTITNPGDHMTLPWGDNESTVTFRDAQYPTTIVEGHWSFEVMIDGGTGMALWFMFKSYRENGFEGNSFLEEAGIEGYLIFIEDIWIRVLAFHREYTPGNQSHIPYESLIMYQKTWSSLNLYFRGTFKFDVTRQADGNITTWINDKMIGTAINTTYTQSEAFDVATFGRDFGFDNLLIDNDATWYPDRPGVEPVTETVVETSLVPTTITEQTPVSFWAISIGLMLIPIVKRRK